MHPIVARGLSRAFGELMAVQGLDLEVPAGEIFGLVGPDGAGKTTTMRLLASILEPSGGEAWVAGFHIVKQAEAVKEKIGYLGQRFGLYPDLTVQENIHFFADLYGVSRRHRQERMEGLLAFSGLGPFRRRKAAHLSGGMRQKLALACALIHTPRVLLLDEPTSGLDPVSRRDLWRLLHQLRREEVTILISTAYLEEAERCGRVGLMHRGRLLASGRPEQIKGMVRGAILEIRPSHPWQAFQILREKLAPAPVSLCGERIHVSSSDPVGASQQIRKSLEGTGMETGEIREVSPTLEDVFVSVLASPGEVR
jgi:ABC-2 type transport system ATP-binding protein